MMPSAYDVLNLSEQKIANAIQSGEVVDSGKTPKDAACDCSVDVRYADPLDALIKEAYLQQVRQYSPDHHPEKFQQIRDAYEQIKTLRLRVNDKLFREPEVNIMRLLKASLPQTARKRPTKQQFLQALKESL